MDDALTIVRAKTVRELSELLRAAPALSDSKANGEFVAVRSWAYSPIFETSFGAATGPFEFRRGSDPPDFCVIEKNGKIAIEATQFTSGQLEVFFRERNEPGPFTSTLLGKKADKSFRAKLRGGSLADDSTAIPHVEAVSDLDAAYATVATEVLRVKTSDLLAYRSGYWKCILLVHDKLSQFKSDWERRVPVLRGVLACLAKQAKFDEIILVDGNHYPTETALKL